MALSAKILPIVSFVVINAVFVVACTTPLAPSRGAPIENRTQTPNADTVESNAEAEAPISPVAPQDKTVTVTPLASPDFSRIETLDAPGPESIAADDAHSDASAVLLAQANNALAAGDLRTSESITNRALRISPREPSLWLQLARIRMKQGDFDAALSTGERAVALSGEDKQLKDRSLRIVAAAHRQLGDEAAAVAVLKRLARP